LNNDQEDKLQADVASLKQVMQARHQGETVDWDQLKATFDDLHGIVDSGAFQEADQKQLDQDFQVSSTSVSRAVFRPECLGLLIRQAYSPSITGYCTLISGSP
jgi:hypothetical protein